MRKLLIFGIVLFMAGFIGMMFTRDEIYSTSIYSEQKTITSPYNKINIDVMSGGVLLLPSKDKTTQIKTKDVKNKTFFKYEVKSDTLTITNNQEIKNKRIFNYGFEQSHEPAIEIYLPKQTYEKVTINTNKAEIDGKYLNAKNVLIHSKVGLVSFDQLEADHADLKVGTGEIDISKTNVKRLDLDVTIGEMNLEKIYTDSDINGHVGTGEANLTFEKQPTNTAFNIQSKNGDIEMNDIAGSSSVLGKGEHTVKLTVGLGTVNIDKE